MSLAHPGAEGTYLMGDVWMMRHVSLSGVG
jgi:hypothetical protein